MGLLQGSLEPGTEPGSNPPPHRPQSRHWSGDWLCSTQLSLCVPALPAVLARARPPAVWAHGGRVCVWHSKRGFGVPSVPGAELFSGECPEEAKGERPGLPLLTLSASSGGSYDLCAHVSLPGFCVPSCRRATCWYGTSSSCAGLLTGTRLTPGRPSCTCWLRWTSGRQRVGMGAPWCIVCECSPGRGRVGEGRETGRALRNNTKESRLQALSQSLTP